MSKCFIIMHFISLVENVFQGSHADDMYNKKKNHCICHDLLWIVTGAFHFG